MVDPLKKSWHLGKTLRDIRIPQEHLNQLHVISTFVSLKIYLHFPSGPAPEIINGRIAMWAFFYGGLSELAGAGSFLDQLVDHPFGVSTAAITITLASFIPTLVAEVPFGELLDTATEDGLPSNVKYFTYATEKLHARIAMTAFPIFLALEIVTGQSVVGLAKSFL